MFLVGFAVGFWAGVFWTQWILSEAYPETFAGNGREPEKARPHWRRQGP